METSRTVNKDQNLVEETVPGNRMKAIVQLAYGSPDDLQLQEVDKPAVDDDDVLVRVRASSVNALEWHLLTGLPHLVRPQAGLSKPKRMVLGADVAGQVEAVGKNVTRLQPGDEVFGDIGFGAYAEYVCAPEHKLVLKPAGLTFEQAAVRSPSRTIERHQCRSRCATSGSRRYLPNQRGQNTSRTTRAPRNLLALAAADEKRAAGLYVRSGIAPLRI